VHVCEGTNTGRNANVTVTLPRGLWLHDLDTQPEVVKVKDWVIKGKLMQTMFAQVPCLMLLSTTEEELDKEPMLQWPVNNATTNKEGHTMNGETYFIGFAQSNSWELLAERRLAEAAVQNAVSNTNKADKYVQCLITGLQGAAARQLLHIEDEDLVKFNTKIKPALSPPGQLFNKSGWVLLQCQVLAANAFGPDGLLRNKPVLLLRKITHEDMTTGTANLQVSRPVVRPYVSTKLEQHNGLLRSDLATMDQEHQGHAGVACKASLPGCAFRQWPGAKQVCRGACHCLPKHSSSCYWPVQLQAKHSKLSRLSHKDQGIRTILGHHQQCPPAASSSCT
jgi:hypothetical protein